jgi:hypothetical protein
MNDDPMNACLACLCLFCNRASKFTPSQSTGWAITSNLRINPCLNETQNDEIALVRRQWNDNDNNLVASYRFGDISDLKWDRVSGGVNSLAPQPFVHGYVWCNEKIAGAVAHSCRHGAGPHRIKVCLTKKDNAGIWQRIMRMVGPKPARYRNRIRNLRSR